MCYFRLSTPTSRHQPPRPAHRTAPEPHLGNPATKPSLAQPDPKSPSLTTSPRSIRCFTYCAAISQDLAPSPGAHPTKRSTHNRARQLPPTLTDIRSRRADPANTHPRPPAPTHTCPRPPTSPCTRAHRRIESSVLRYLDFRPGLGPDLRDIAAQYSSDNPTPESQERDVVHEPVRCPTAPRDVCCDIACFRPRFTSWWEISQHTSLDCRLRGAYG